MLHVMRCVCRSSAALAVILALPALTGCQTPVDISAVNDYVKTVNAASVGFRDVAADFGASCLRFRELSLTEPGDLRSVPALDAPADPTRTGPSFDFQSALPKCRLAAGVSDQWNKRNVIIVGYVRALGAIAGVDTKPTGFDALATQLQDVGVIKKATVAPFASVATTIASMVFVGKQEALLKKYVHDADPSLQAAVTSLSAFTQDEYMDLLRNELTLVDSRYRTSVRDHTKGAFDLIAVESERADWLARRTSVLRRMDAATAYADAIEKIAKTNAQLVAASDKNMSFGAEVQVAREFVSQIGDDVATLVKSFK